MQLILLKKMKKINLTKLNYNSNEKDSEDDNSSENDNENDNSSENDNEDDNSNENDNEDDNSNDNDSKDCPENESDLYQTNKYKFFFKNFSKQLPENFFKQRKIGQNKNYICKLIREDSIDEFITYVNQHDYSLNINIEQSIYETNSFFGSIQIFKYLYKNGVELTSSLWLFGIHSDNAEIIHFLEENNIEPSKNQSNVIIMTSQIIFFLISLIQILKILIKLILKKNIMKTFIHIVLIIIIFHIF